MQVSYFLLLFFTIGFLLFLFQRTEAKKRRIVALVMVVLSIVIFNFIRYRNLHSEAQAAFVSALVVNFLFWVLIGRYNPPKSSDEIQVIGMDD
jgi:hypothetical protein